MKKFLKMLKDSKGATAIEYGLLAALISIAAIVAMRSLGEELSLVFGNVTEELRDR